LVHVKALQAVKKKTPMEKSIAQIKTTGYMKGKGLLHTPRYGPSWRDKNVPPIETYVMGGHVNMKGGMVS